MGNYDEAIECYEKAIEINPKYVDAWNDKGLALERSGGYEEAIECYDRAIDINPEYFYAWGNKGSSLFNLGKYEEAIEYFDKAREINKEYFDTSVWNSMRSEFINDRLDEAEEYLNKKDYDLSGIIIPIRCLQEVSKYAGLNKRFHKLKKDACIKLKKYRDDVFRWISRNEQEIRVERGLESLYKELDLLSGYLYFDKIIDILDTPHAVVLNNLDIAINKKWDLNKYIYRTMPIIEQLIRGPQLLE